MTSAFTEALRRPLKTFLTTLGLLPAVRSIRDRLRVVRAIQSNIHYWFRGSPDGLSLPPARLILLVAGTPDVAWFLTGGRLAFESIGAALSSAGLDARGFETVLDFGCGCGRVTRHWAGSPAAIYGCDYNRKLVDWCRRNLPFARFEKNELAPPLVFAAGTFDFVYALSVFTHLPEPLQISWMKELRRILKPDRHFLLTVHGTRYVEHLTEDERRRFESGRLVVKEGFPGSNRFGAYHPYAYVKEILAEGFTLVDFIPEGARGNPHQDVYLLRRS